MALCAKMKPSPIAMILATVSRKVHFTTPTSLSVAALRARKTFESCWVSQDRLDPTEPLFLFSLCTVFYKLSLGFPPLVSLPAHDVFLGRCFANSCELV